ncbi:hydroxyquinol 1,2-dioxygenase [Acidisoma cellulosilytica]|uniref:Hydroxyquinol 1,2-dioxygenase n=1 Tax=Acidisoma cellulosilyticum TaxID=2802395 RepID=A0A963Z548_9PROT|nr:dioxygenase [Acidisoma cellulosilyticum]MCB8882994.1 hydroxyquinol 1,2-dioxygenase [Acidisoma cellulosilyticum]
MHNLDENTITAEFLRRIEKTPNPRLREIVASLATHLHDFARDVNLTEEEWFEGIKFLTRTGQMSNDIRQEMVLLSDTFGLSQLVVAQNHSRGEGVTEQTVFGPFHIEGAPKLPAHGGDISTGYVGDPLFIRGRVIDGAEKPVVDAVVDVWQADAEGFYDVQNPDWELENAKLRAVFRTDNAGSFSLRSIMPTSYPIPMDGPVGDIMRATNRHPMRPAHIHFMIQKPGFDTLVTHVFVEGDTYLDSDAVFGVRSSCVGRYERHERGEAPDGTVLEAPFFTLDYTFSLAPQA